MRKSAVLATGMTLALALSACGGGNGGDAEGEGGGEFNIAWNAQPPSMDPMKSTANATRDLGRHIYEPLVTLDANDEVQPVLAESFEMAEDNQSITFTLREDVPFHDGDIMDAEDAVASAERWLEESGTAAAYFPGTEVESPEEGVVTMTFEEPVPMAPVLLADQNISLAVMKAELLEEAGPDGVEEHIGTGPYELGDWATDQHISFERFEDYVSPEGESSGSAGEKNPYFDTITFHFVPDASTRVAGIQSGEYDAAASIPWDNADMFDNDDNVNLSVDESGFTIGIYNKAEGPMADVNMRRAVLAAIEPTENLDSAFNSSEFYSVSGALLPQDSPLFVDVDEELQQGRDLDAVEEYLEEADYDGEPVRLITTRDYDQLYNLTVVLQDQLEEAGINTEMNVHDWPTVSEAIQTPDDWDIFIDSPSWRALPNLHNHLQPTNAGWTEDEAIETAMDAIILAEDDDEAREAIGQLHEAYYDYLPAARFGDGVLVTALSSDYEGFDFTAPSGAIYYNMRPAE